ncbi:uncharacterized protein L201_001633 [Kwoniella dendrophila CBS 6074]|uniref:Uncharacterized protein n=1 Tax=Kwoniella dendrophila CBS 6074 TaxID=1295534 RepID=A0AAX4JPT1_9TREE
MPPRRVSGTMKSGTRLPDFKGAYQHTIEIEEGETTYPIKQMIEDITETFAVSHWRYPKLITDTVTICSSGNRTVRKEEIAYLKERNWKAQFQAQRATDADFEVDYIWDPNSVFEDLLEALGLPKVMPPFQNKFDNLRIRPPPLRFGNLVNTHDIIHSSQSQKPKHIMPIHPSLDYGQEADIIGCNLIHPAGKRSSGCSKGQCDTTAEVLAYFPLINVGGDIFQASTISVSNALDRDRTLKPFLHPNRKWSVSAGLAALCHVAAIKDGNCTWDLSTIPKITLKKVAQDFATPACMPKGNRRLCSGGIVTRQVNNPQDDNAAQERLSSDKESIIEASDQSHLTPAGQEAIEGIENLDALVAGMDGSQLTLSNLAKSPIDPQAFIVVGSQVCINATMTELEIDKRIRESKDVEYLAGLRKHKEYMSEIKGRVDGVIDGMEKKSIR